MTGLRRLPVKNIPKIHPGTTATGISVEARCHEVLLVLGLFTISSTLCKSQGMARAV
jgi:hypothetical protein